jgi:cyanophycinase
LAYAAGAPRVPVAPRALDERRVGEAASRMPRLRLLPAVGALLLAASVPSATVQARQPAVSVAASDLPVHGPPTGHLVIAGGGNLDGTGILERFIELAGGPAAKIVVVPTAGGNRRPDGSLMPYEAERVLAPWKARGLTNVHMLHTADPKVADTPAFAALLAEARGVWFNGGRQWHLVDSYAGTRTLRAFEAVLAHGGVIGGSSAGATIQGTYLVRGAVSGPQVMMAPEPEHQEAFGFLRRSAIDQHVDARNRWDDLQPVLERFPDYLGLGISEGTALIVRRDTFEVIGKADVAIHEPRAARTAGAPPYRRVPPGTVYDMRARRVVGAADPGPDSLPSAQAAIREADLRRDLALLAGDGMRGREAGTADELRASVWIAEQLRAIGLEPMGTDGSFFQWFDMRRTRLGASSVVRVGDVALQMWRDVAATGTAVADLTAPTIWLADPRDSSVDVRGAVVLARLAPPPSRGRETSVNSAEYRYARTALQQLGFALTRRGAAGVLLVADATADLAFDGVARIAARGTYRLDEPAPRQAGSAAPVMLVRGALAERLRAVAGAPATIRLHQESFTYPSVNIIGRVRGTDPALRDEHVLFSSHQDHDGDRYAIAGDSTWNGADDNGTTSVALLAIARAFVQQPARRSALFVYHGAEERGLLGSTHHVRHPVVPLDRIVAVLNGDMLGRNHPDSAALLGAQSPHRNSTDLVAMAQRANALTGRFALDTLWDRPDHPEGWYFRSDHLPYARANVPALFFSSLLHADYHTPRDEPARIDHAKLTRMTRWLYATGWLAASADRRPGLDPGFRLER